jgi:hypothetical protein
MTDDLIEGEIIEGTDLAVINQQDAPTALAPLNLFGPSPAAALESMGEIARLLTDVLNKQRLFSVIQGKKHVTVEGWTLLGSLLGVFPIVVSTERVTEPADGYKARVEARTADGRVVGAGEALCARAERTWKSRDEFALMAMAQTRATSRALRNPLGFVVKMAGYETAGVEEMPLPAASDVELFNAELPKGARPVSVVPEPLMSDVAALLVAKEGKTAEEAHEWLMVNQGRPDLVAFLQRAKQQLEAKPDKVAS